MVVVLVVVGKEEMEEQRQRDKDTEMLSRLHKKRGQLYM